MSNKSQKGNIDLDNTEFQTVLNLIENTSDSIFMTGRAGTGKSTFLRYIRDNIKKKCVVLAPTGIAAVNVGGQTLHSFFKLPFKPLLPGDPEFASRKRMKARLKYSASRVKLLQEVQLIIIDEISMVRADIIDFIDRILRCYTNNDRQPFGGKQLLLVGDTYQLEPVVTADMRDILSREYPSPYFFNAKVFQQFGLIAVELLKVYRQSDLDFVEMLDRIRVGCPTDTDILNINSRIVDDETEANTEQLKMTIATRREMVDNINQTHLDELTSSEVKYLGKVSGVFPENSYPTDLELVLKVGAQIVFVKNDSDHSWVNGTIGRVIETSPDVIRVQLENGDTHTVEKAIWENVKYVYDEETKKVSEEVIGTFTQYPVKLAWALTIHKSQGLTFNKVSIDVGHGAFTGGQTYVALSRCTSLDGISLRSTINKRDIFVSPVIRKFSQRFNDPSQVDQAIKSARANAAYIGAARAFNKDNYQRAVELFAEATSLRNDLQDPKISRLISFKLNSFKHFKDEIARLKDDMLEQRLHLRQLSDEYVEQGDECRDEGLDVTLTLSHYDNALKIFPENIDAMIGKAKTLFDISDADSAISILERAAKIDSKDWRPQYELGKLFFACGDNSNALDRLLVASEISPKSAFIHDILADVYQAIGDNSSSRSHRNAASRLRRKK